MWEVIKPIETLLVDLSKSTHHVVRIVNEGRLPLALVVGVLDHWCLPLPAPYLLTGGIGWIERIQQLGSYHHVGSYRGH